MYIKLRELIVTQWDVNDEQTEEPDEPTDELIVTQWDVNAVIVSREWFMDYQN